MLKQISSAEWFFAYSWYVFEAVIQLFRLRVTQALFFPALHCQPKQEGNTCLCVPLSANTTTTDITRIDIIDIIIDILMNNKPE